MKSFRKLFAAVIILLLAMFAAVNLLLTKAGSGSMSHEYRVEISRLSAAIGAGETPDLSACKYVTAVSADDGSAEFLRPTGTYAVQKINGTLYRFDYSTGARQGRLRLLLNAALTAISAAVIGILLWVRARIIKPFAELTGLPAELAKGNLTAPLSENRSRYFGKFVWGINLLRETLEQSRAREFALQKQQQTLILSVSHDIKTPLSAIMLYAKALEKGLYPDAERQRHTARQIAENADRIEQFVSELTRSASEDFLELHVENGEFYLSGVMNGIRAVYTERFAVQQTEFAIGEYRDCLLCGDADRAAEVLQNLLENALKYGAGGKTEIRFSDEEDCRLITVANAGCTLPETEAVHMFDSFWRGSNAQGKSGSGLGLYICRRLMQAMDGEIFAQTAEGEMRVTAVFRKA